jgi:hypothetical protein
MGGNRGKKVRDQKIEKVLKELQKHDVKTVAHDNNISQSEVYKLRGQNKNSGIQELITKLRVRFGLAEDLNILLPDNSVWIMRMRVVASHPCDYNVTVRAISGTDLDPVNEVIILGTQGVVLEYAKLIPYRDRNDTKKLHLRIYWGTVLNLKYVPNVIEFNVAVWVQPMNKEQAENIRTLEGEASDGSTKVLSPIYYGTDKSTDLRVN